ncbi:MAG: acetyl-CoA carboxylase biotin carboxyl carrier protein subunit [Acidobacteriota bacterium]
MKISSGERVREVRLERDAAVLDGERVAFRVCGNGAAGEVIETGGRRHRVRAAGQGDRVFVWCDGQVYEFTRARGSDRGADRGDLRAPMPGRIRKNFVSAGEAVKRGQVLLILEAMKMEHAIRSPRDGAVRRLPHAEGDLVEAGTVLVELGEGPAAG